MGSITKDKLAHKEYHWKHGVKYLLEYFRVGEGIESRMTEVITAPVCPATKRHTLLPSEDK